MPAEGALERDQGLATRTNPPVGAKGNRHRPESRLAWLASSVQLNPINPVQSSSVLASALASTACLGWVCLWDAATVADTAAAAAAQIATAHLQLALCQTLAAQPKWTRRHETLQACVTTRHGNSNWSAGILGIKQQ